MTARKEPWRPEVGEVVVLRSHRHMPMTVVDLDDDDSDSSRAPQVIARVLLLDKAHQTQSARIDIRALVSWVDS